MERLYERYMFLSLKKYVKVHKFDGEVVKNTASSYQLVARMTSAKIDFQ